MPPPPSPRTPLAHKPAESKPRFNSRELFRGHQELVIEHAGEEYRLRLTRNDKLILNK